MSKNRWKWTPEEDEKLLKLRKNNMPYKKLPAHFPGRSQDAIRNRAYILQESGSNEWLKDEVVAVYDIETTDLNANVGFLMSWALRMPDGTMKSDHIKRREVLNDKLDKRILKSLLEALKEVDVLVGYYSRGFDDKFVRTRCQIQGLRFPKYGEMKCVDLYFMVRNKFKLTNNRLATACDAFGLEAKTHEPLKVWNSARRGVQKSIDALAEYNKNDVEITYQLYEIVKDYYKIARRSI